MIKTQVKIGRRRSNDPTLSNTLIIKYFIDFHNRFKLLKKDVKEKITEPGFLKYKGSATSFLTMAKKRYEYQYEAETIRDFSAWLDVQVTNGFLTYEKDPMLRKPGSAGLWSDVYIYSSYQKGIARALMDVQSLGLPGAKALDAATYLAGAFNSPFHADRVNVLYARAFNDMRGLTESMKTVLSDTLAKGMAQGIGPNQIARNITQKIDNFDKVRARLIARTEIINAHNVANLNTLESLSSVVGEEIKAQWWTALDERVRSSHRLRHGIVYTINDAHSLIGEPNCRCTLLPWTQTVADIREKFEGRRKLVKVI